MHPSLTSANYDRRANVDPRIPLWLFIGPTNKSKSELIKHVTNGISTFGKTCALVFTRRSCWAEAWRGGTLISDNLARSASGTICCYGGDIVNAFYQLHLRKLGLLSPKLDYDTVLIGLDDELNTGSFVTLVQNDERLEVTYCIARVICTINPSHCTLAMDETLSRCIGEADTLILTNREGCKDSDIRAAQSILATVNPLAATFHADTPSFYKRPAWKIPLGGFSETAGQTLAYETGMVRVKGSSERTICFVGNLYNEAGTNTPEDAHITRAMRVNIPGELDIKNFFQVVDQLTRTLGTALLRLSVLLNISHTDYPISFEIIGGSLMQPAYGSNHRLDHSDICIIAKGLDTQQTLRAFEQCTRMAAVTDACLEAAI